jgi:hypothetical protein
LSGLEVSACVLGAVRSIVCACVAITCVILRSGLSLRACRTGSSACSLVKLFGELARKAEKSEISDRAVDMRGMLDALDLIRQGLSSGQALELTIVSKTFDRYEQTLIRDCIGSRIPADLDRSVVFAG